MASQNIIAFQRYGFNGKGENAAGIRHPFLRPERKKAAAFWRLLLPGDAASSAVKESRRI
jgi:hypothetical protein